MDDLGILSIQWLGLSSWMYLVTTRNGQCLSPLPLKDGYIRQRSLSEPYLCFCTSQRTTNLLISYTFYLLMICLFAIPFFNKGNFGLLDTELYQNLFPRGAGSSGNVLKSIQRPWHFVVLFYSPFIPFYSWHTILTCPFIKQKCPLPSSNSQEKQVASTLREANQKCWTTLISGKNSMT